tara:strand:- start:234 stop:623 length:390 start_codon:yes stop_codon:yes gene_type:complete
MPEVRYWPRIGMRVDRETADSFISKLVVGDVGSILDEDIDEFVAVTPLTPETLSKEIDTLFASPLEDSEPIFDEVNLAILELMTFEGQRKSFIMERKAEGMSTEDAKEAYDIAKADLVRKHLPEKEEEE